MKPALTLIYRDARPGNYSIEQLFAALEPKFRNDFELSEIVLPNSSIHLRGFIKNILHACRQSKGIKHVTGDTHYLAIFLRGRIVLTIHDCGHLLKLRGFKKLIYKWLWFRLPCWRSSAVTVISESTKEVLEQELGPMGNKIRVIENCLSIPISPSTRRFDANRPRILQIGTGRHKNLDTLIESVIGIPCELHIVGRISDSDLASLNRANIQFVNEFNVSSQRLAEIYGECDLLYFASRHEGFGLPILEAQAAGIPVITANVFSMPFVAGDGAILVNPESSQQVREAIRTICDDARFRQRLVEFGMSNLKRFQPAAIAEKYCSLYRELLDAR